MKAKVKKFVETADPSAAALLHSKMDTLCQRFSDACDNHREKVSKLEQLKEKVEKFEELADKVQQFVVKRSQDLHETDGPGKTFTELSQLMQVNVNINDHVCCSIVAGLLFIISKSSESPTAYLHCRILKLKWPNMPVMWRHFRICPRNSQR